ncbi:MAG: hypothetical protein JNN32_03250 [Flavobacteriales bacterium]|nr:hypothetical protein [Flavobacteriales bacterium]
MKDPNTIDELREAPLLRSLPKEDPFVAPKDFFEFFPHAVQQAAYQVDRERRRHTPLLGDVKPLRFFGSAAALLGLLVAAIVLWPAPTPAGPAVAQEWTVDEMLYSDLDVELIYADADIDTDLMDLVSLPEDDQAVLAYLESEDLPLDLLIEEL